MITKEFLTELEKVRQSFDWKLVRDTDWLSERRSQPRLCIRATSVSGPADFLFDPIGALCFIRTGHRHDPDAWLDSADELQLSLIAAGDLTAAANDRTWEEVSGSRAPDPQRQRLRNLLLASIGTQEVRT